MPRPGIHSLIWALSVVVQTSSKKDFQQFLNLNSAQEVALYLFPVSVLFLDRDWSFKIVHPNNGATAGTVVFFLFPFFPPLGLTML